MLVPSEKLRVQHITPTLLIEYTKMVLWFSYQAWKYQHLLRVSLSVDTKVSSTTYCQLYCANYLQWMALSTVEMGRVNKM